MKHNMLTTGICFQIIYQEHGSHVSHTQYYWFEIKELPCFMDTIKQTLLTIKMSSLVLCTLIEENLEFRGHH